MEKQTYSVDEAAAILGVSRPHLYKVIRNGDLPAIKIGQRILVPKRALDTLLGSAPSAT